MAAVMRCPYFRGVTDSADLLLQIRAALIADADVQRRQCIRAVLRNACPPSLARPELLASPATGDVQAPGLDAALPAQRVPDALPAVGFSAPA